MENKRKTVLILGNGFDLAHNLPTRYSDFLEFCKRVELIFTYRTDIRNEEMLLKYNKEHIENWKIHQEIKDKLLTAFETRKSVGIELDNEIVSNDEVIEELHKCLKENVWYKYLDKIFQENLIKGENWIDFEAEITIIIQVIDGNMRDFSQLCYKLLNQIKKDEIYSDKIEIFEKALNDVKYGVIKCTIGELKKKLVNDLLNLVRALELYLVYFVEKLPVDLRQEDVLAIEPDFIINFNYTNTYERLYNSEKEVFHIHGKCAGNRTVEENNMVLGIGNYESQEDDDRNIKFKELKKSIQRISKKTGTENYKYLDEIKKIYKESREKGIEDGLTSVYIFGHSLHVTDKDILFDFLENEATDVTVFCKDKKTNEELIANIIGIIGEEGLFRKTHQAHSRLNFTIQRKPTKVEPQGQTVRPVKGT